jgi:hypothetical protein
VRDDRVPLDAGPGPPSSQRQSDALAGRGDPANQGRALLRRADSVERRGHDVGEARHLEEARDHRYQALEVLVPHQLEQPGMIAEVSRALALDHPKAGEWELAAAAVQRADLHYDHAELADPASESEIAAGRSDLRLRLGELAADQGRLDEAMGYWREADHYSPQMGREADSLRTSRLLNLLTLRRETGRPAPVQVPDDGADYVNGDPVDDAIGALAAGASRFRGWVSTPRRGSIRVSVMLRASGR